MAASFLKHNSTEAVTLDQHETRARLEELDRSKGCIDQTDRFAEE